MDKRFYYLDNLKVLLCVFVIIVHVAVTYGSLGGWFYLERETGDLTMYLLSGFNAIQETYFMALFFFIAAYFLPASIKKRGRRALMLTKLKRLGVPVLLFMVFMNPVIHLFVQKVMYRNTMSISQIFSSKMYFPYGAGPLWFCIALLIFIGITILVDDKRLFTKVNLPESKVIVKYLLGVAVIQFVIRLVYPYGSWLLWFQIGCFGHYGLLFIAGLYAKEGRWIESISKKMALHWLFVVSIGIVLLPVLMVSSPDLSLFFGGTGWRAIVFLLWQLFVGTGIMINMCYYFYGHMNHTSHIQKFLARNTFRVYILHTPVVIFCSFLLKEVSAHGFIKFLVVSMMSVPLSFIVAEESNKIFRRIPLFQSKLSENTNQVRVSTVRYK